MFQISCISNINVYLAFCTTCFRSPVYPILISTWHSVLHVSDLPCLQFKYPPRFLDTFQISYASGIDGYPAFLIKNMADIRTPSSTFFKKNKLFRDFSMLVTVKPELEEGGILFAVVNPEQTLISFGLELGQTDAGKVNLTLYYQDYRFNGQFGPFVTFEVPR